MEAQLIDLTDGLLALAMVVCGYNAARTSPVSAHKVGGIWFVRIGRFRFSFCRTRQ